ncbi:hypothetical protein ACH5RR_019824, partial [Cinchona calisaya]
AWAGRAGGQHSFGKISGVLHLFMVLLAGLNNCSSLSAISSIWKWGGVLGAWDFERRGPFSLGNFSYSGMRAHIDFVCLQLVRHLHVTMDTTPHHQVLNYGIR